MKKAPETIGKYLAQFQHLVDSGVEWGAKKLDNIDDSPSNKPTFKNKHAQKAVEGGKTVVKGVGRMGKSYYKEYEVLKKKKDEKHCEKKI